MSGLTMPPVNDLQGMTMEILKAMYDIWGVSVSKQRGSYAFQTDPYPMVGSATQFGTTTGTIQVSTSGAFILTKHAVHADTLDFAITWKSGGSDRRWTDRENGGHVENLGGIGEWPFVYPQPYVWEGGSTITCQVQSLTANSRNVYWDFFGWRIWDVSALDLTRRAG